MEHDGDLDSIWSLCGVEINVRSHDLVVTLTIDLHEKIKV